MPIDWGKCAGRPTLMLPGPTELPQRVMDALHRPAEVQYDLAFNNDVLEPLHIALKEVFQTRGEVVTLPGSGRTALEASAMSVIEPDEPVLVIIAGFFGMMMKAAVERAGANITVLEVEWGQPLDLDRVEAEAKRIGARAITMVHNETTTGTVYPVAEVARIAHARDALLLVDTVSSLGGLDIPTDEWGIDLNMAAPQKCLAGPVGVGMVSISERAQARMDARKKKAHTWINDLKRWKDEWLTTDRGGGVEPGAFRMTPVGISSHMTHALAACVELALEEGLPNRFERHRVAGEALFAGLSSMGLEPYPPKAIASHTVCCVRAPDGVNAVEVVKLVESRFGMKITAGLAKLATTTLRVGTMGMAASPAYVLPVLSALELSLHELGHKTEPGAGLMAAQRVFREAHAA